MYNPIHIKIKRSLAIAAFEIVFFVSIFISSFFFTACSNTVDTRYDTIIHHDTIPGPALVRFLTMLNNSNASNIVLLKMNSPQDQNIFTDVNPNMSKQFIPIAHDSVFVLYANYFYGAGTPKNDSITIPPFKPYSMHTVVLFRTNDVSAPNRLFPIFADDSTRRMTAPKDSCYIRLINGLPDYPQPSPLVNLHIDNINAPAFFKDKTTGLSAPVSFQEIRNYVLMPAGSHQLFVRSDGDITQSYSTSQQFIPGEFYTIRLTGMKSDGTDKLSIDAE